jgi:hypothetical protein
MGETTTRSELFEALTMARSDHTYFAPRAGSAIGPCTWLIKRGLGQFQRKYSSALFAGIFLDCGGKRSATPLCFSALRGHSHLNWRAQSASGTQHRGKSAVVVTLCRRNPK